MDMRLTRVLACAVATGVLLSGCQSSISGTAVTSPGRGPTNPQAATELQPQNGYVFIQSGQTRCQIDEDEVGCEAPFANTPIKDGMHANGVNLHADGTVEWIVGNLGDIPVVTIDYRTYRALGWRIEASEDGTRFTNERTGHGMFVSIDSVDTF